MDYAASKQFLSPRGVSAAGEDSAAMCWELDEGVTAARQETWLLSFIDILALLLTLLVLLLAYQDQDHRLEQKLAAGAPQNDARSAVALQTPLTAYNGPRLFPPALDAAHGYVAPGEALLPPAVASTVRWSVSASRTSASSTTIGAPAS